MYTVSDLQFFAQCLTSVVDGQPLSADDDQRLRLAAEQGFTYGMTPDDPEPQLAPTPPENEPEP
jgi:hypothetical protein